MHALCKRKRRIGESKSSSVLSSTTLSSGFDLQSVLVFLIYQMQLGQIEIIKRILRIHPKVSETKTRCGLYLIHIAANRGYPSTLAVLTNVPPNTTNIQDQYGFTPLMYAVWNGHVMTTDLLLSAGANPNQYSIDPHWSSLFYAVHASSKQPKKMALYSHIVKRLLLSGADPVATDADGWPALFYCNIHNLAVAKALVKRGANLADLELSPSHVDLHNDPGLSQLFDHRLSVICESLSPFMPDDIIDYIIELSFTPGIVKKK